MADPMNSIQYIAQLKKWGITSKTYRTDWQTHNRTNATGKTFGRVYGVMLHHTGSDSNSPSVLWNGYQDLPGPLCHAGNDSKGLVWHIGWGYANHAGLGDEDVLSAVVAENYGERPPTDNEANTDGNKHFYGMEVMYSGSHGMTKSQYSTMTKWAAALCDFHGWTAKSVIAHGEWQPGKWDPGYAPGRMMDMNAIRNDIQDLLDSGPMKDAESEIKPAVVSDEYKRIWRTDSVQVDYLNTTDNPYWWAENVLRDIHRRIIAIEKKVNENG